MEPKPRRADEQQVAGAVALIERGARRLPFLADDPVIIWVRALSAPTLAARISTEVVARRYTSIISSWHIPKKPPP